MKENRRVVPKKNYLYLIIMFIMVVIITFSIVNIAKYYDEKKLENSYLNGYITEVTLEEVESVLTEPSSEMFIIVTEVNNENVYNFEKKLKKIIKSRDIRDNIIYIISKDDNDISELNKILNSNINSVPGIIYYKNGEYVTSIDGNDGLIDAGEFEQLLDSYEVE